MGEDQKHLSVDGEPLANVLGKLATDMVMGRKTSNQGLEEMRQLRDRLPEGSKARTELGRAIEHMATPPRAPLKMPEGTPPVLSDLMEKLSHVPLARGDSRFGHNRESTMDRLAKVGSDWAERVQQYRDAGMNQEQINKRIKAFLSEDLRSKVYSHEHESREGKMEIDRLIEAAIKQIRGE